MKRTINLRKQIPIRVRQRGPHATCRERAAVPFHMLQYPTSAGGTGRRHVPYVLLLAIGTTLVVLSGCRGRETQTSGDGGKGEAGTKLIKVAGNPGLEMDAAG